MEKERKKYAEMFSEMGVLGDWASLYQKDPTLFDKNETPDAKPEGPQREAFAAGLKKKETFYGGEAYDKSRTEAENTGFAFALNGTMDLWYAHQGTSVYMLTKL